MSAAGKRLIKAAKEMRRRGPNWRPAVFTYEANEVCGNLYYFAPADRAPGPYRKQIHVQAIIDIAADGTLAGVELIDDMPPLPAPSREDSPHVAESEIHDRVDFVDGHLDEVVSARGAHLEYMDKNRWFLIFYHADGAETAIWFSSRDLKKQFWETRQPCRQESTDGQPIQG